MPSTRKQRFSITGFLKLTRFPNLLIIGLTQYIAAVFLVPYPNEAPGLLLSARLFLLVASTLMIAAAGYIINDYYDVKIDYVNKPDRVVVGKLIRRRIVLASHLTLNFLGVAIGFVLHPYVGVVNFLAAFLLWLYSNQLKRMPFIGNFIIALLTGFSLVVIAIYYQKNTYLILNYAVFAFSINLVREIIKDMEDLKGDKRFGSKTLPIIWGIRKTKVFLYSLMSVFTVLFVFMTWQLANPILTGFFLILIVPLLYFVYLLYRADTQRRFGQLSSYCKVFMLTGILSMIFF